MYLSLGVNNNHRGDDDDDTDEKAGTISSLWLLEVPLTSIFKKKTLSHRELKLL